MSAGRYNFEFYRHTCGRMIGIYDTEPCLCEIESKVEKVTKTMAVLRRLLRRARVNGHTPEYIHHNDGVAVTVFACRKIRIWKDGKITPDSVPRYTASGLSADPHWKDTIFRRWHTDELNHAAWYRRHGWIKAARRAVDDARRYRLIGDDNAI